jgi:alpha-ketoglutarate-dependent taurine dioxygenase
MTQLAPVTSLNVQLEHGKPPMLRADTAGDAARWAAEHRDALRAAVTEHGSLLVRGLGLRDAAETEKVFRELGTLMTEREGFAERRVHAQGVYSASKWPPSQPMCVHHELSYAVEFPSLMMFACLTTAARGGATPVADSGAVLDALPAELVGRFERVGWLLIRNYNEDIGASITDAFSTGEPDAVEGYCRSHEIDFEWLPDGTLRTRQRRHAVARHPFTGRRCWFNQIAFLSQWTLAPEVREYLVDVYGEDGLPFDTRFGNGDPIGADVVELINATYEANTVREPWDSGDLLLVDNIRTAHGREAFDGPREVVVGMADPVRGTWGAGSGARD